MMKSTTKNVIKFHDVLLWLFTTNKIPEQFIEQKTKLNSIVPYVVEQLWCHPRLTKYLNIHTNDLFNIPDPISHLELLQKIIQVNGITRYQLWNFIPFRGPDQIKILMEENNLSENDAKIKLQLIEARGQYEVKPKLAPTKKNTDLTADLEAVRLVVEQDLKLKKKEADDQLQRVAAKTSHLFLSKLDQDVIDQNGLVLFDITVLKKTNRVLFIFIDDQNTKRYFTENFSAEIFISGKDGVINNDYIVDKSDQFTRYIINNVAQYGKLKFMINNSYKRILNGY